MMLLLVFAFLLSLPLSAVPFQNGPHWLLYRMNRSPWALLMPYQAEEWPPAEYTLMNPVQGKVAVIKVDSETGVIKSPDWNAKNLKDIPESLNRFPSNPRELFSLDDLIEYTEFWQPFPVYVTGSQSKKAIVFDKSRFRKEWQHNLRAVSADARLGQLCLSVSFNQFPQHLESVILDIYNDSGSLLQELTADLGQKNGLLYDKGKKTAGWFSGEAQKLVFFLPLSMRSISKEGSSVHITFINGKDSYRETYGIGTLYFSDIGGMAD